MKLLMLHHADQHIYSQIDSFDFSSPQDDILKKILVTPVSYIPHPCFHPPKRMNAVMLKEITASRGVLLTDEESQTLFLQLNYSRYLTNKIQQKILKTRSCTQKQLILLLGCYEKQMKIRETIITSNIGLVLGMAKKTLYSGIEITDLISEGSIALLCAADKFDCSRGFKFSTYACKAILRGFSRAAKKTYRYRAIFSAQLNTAFEKDDSLERIRDERQNGMAEEVRKIYQNNLAELSGLEHSVVAMRFSLKDRSVGPLTLLEAGNRLGLSKERVRQIQSKALVKLRLFTEEYLFPKEKCISAP